MWAHFFKPILVSKLKRYTNSNEKWLLKEKVKRLKLLKKFTPFQPFSVKFSIKSAPNFSGFTYLWENLYGLCGRNFGEFATLRRSRRTVCQCSREVGMGECLPTYICIMYMYNFKRKTGRDTRSGAPARCMQRGGGKVILSQGLNWEEAWRLEREEDEML